MPLSYVQTSGDGVTTNFAIPFQYLDQAHVHVYVSGIEKTFTWLTASTIQVSPAPPAGTLNVEIRRITDRTVAAVDYANGSVLFDTDLDKSTNQSLFVAQEYFEQPPSSIPSGHTLDSHSDATPGESTTKGSMRVYGDGGTTKAIVATDGGILQGDAADSKGVKFLAVGVTGQALETDTALGGKLGWKQSLRHLITSAGDLIVGTALGLGARLAAPLSTNLVLVADTAEALKMKWSSTLAGLTLTSPTINTPTLNNSQFTGNATSAVGSSISGNNTAFNSYSLNLCAINTGCTFGTGLTIPSPTITGNTVGTGAIKTNSGSATSSSMAAGARAQISMNDYSFAPNIEDRGDLDGGANVGGPIVVYGHTTVSGGTTAKLSLFNLGNGTGGYQISWRYITASDDPVMWAIADPITGKIIAMWSSDDPTPGDVPGVEMEGFLSRKFVAKDLEHLSVLDAKASEAEDLIRSTGRRLKHQAYRALQLHSGQNAPSVWLSENCEIDLGNGKLKLK